MRKRLPTCGVCGSQATGYHYGVNTCEACKEFFHRSLGRYQGYRCRNREVAGLCVYKPGKRKSCQFCRFQRCLKAGMSKGAIKIGRYSIVKKSQDENEIKRSHCDNSREDEVKVDKTSRYPSNPSTNTETGGLQYIGQIDSFHANQYTEYAEDDKNTISAYLDTSFSVEKESNSKCGVTGMDMSTRFPLSPQDSKPSPPTLEDTTCVTKADSSMAKGSNSGHFFGHTSSPSMSFTPGESSSVLTPILQSSATGMDAFEFQPCSPTILNSDGADFHGNIRSQAEHAFNFQNSILTPTSDSSPYSLGSSEIFLSPPEGERKQDHVIQNMDHDGSVGECQGDGSIKRETVDEVSDCTFRIPSPFNEKNCKLRSQMVNNCGVQPSSVYHGREPRPKYQDTAEAKDNCETQGKKMKSELADASLEPSQGLLSQADSDQSTLRALSPVPSRDLSRDSLPDVPSHHKPVAARRSLLPSQLPQLFANIDEVIKNLLVAHEENVADFTQMSKEDMIWQQMKHLELYDLKVSTFGRLPLVSGDEYNSIFKLTGIDVDSRKELAQRYVTQLQMYSRAMVQFAHCIPGFFSLEQNHQVKMINKSRIEFIFLTIYPAFNLDIGVGISLAGGWVCNQEVNGFAKACFKAIGEFCDKLQKVDISKEEMVLIKAMLIMTTDREEAVDSPLAKAIHWQLFQLLAEITSRRHKDSAMALAGFMSILHETRRLGEWVASLQSKFDIDIHSDLNG